MQCPDCGAEVVRESVFCPQCGQRLDLEENFSQPPTEGPSDNSPAAVFTQGAKAAMDRPVDPGQQLWQGTFSPKAMIGAWVTTAMIALVMLIVGVVFPHGWLWIAIVTILPLLVVYQFLVLAFRRWNVSYTLTSQRFVHEQGILRRRTERIEVIDMDDISVDQRLLERLVGVGTIWIKSSDTTHPELALLGIENVRQVAGLIDDTRRQERQRRGLHIENI